MGLASECPGGLLITSDLEHVRAPIEHEVLEFNLPPRSRERFCLHGRIAKGLLVCELTGRDIVLALRIRSELPQGALYNGTSGSSARSTFLMSPEIRVCDRITNAGFEPDAPRAPPRQPRLPAQSCLR
jgi:hypothetical protein